ncbi:endonuclease/exonuclease/phosphatase family protein [Streptomyces sp. ST2-7A]|uniref:endonuclease/exonuclease/phosphatase family protein n=1 Tax=Streptomyces sp. ST2-7A TaxID=2907214 RepID=UPI001F48C6E2|nr:endonuclease/exonuclease/phosphatase family protein [Streptomyces sp. ST2-7A]MCE7080063.1 endonuclease/exonuclease/phosphatase family protein [Streptomyces sp. ST2-7A]
MSTSDSPSAPPSPDRSPAPPTGADSEPRPLIPFVRTGRVLVPLALFTALLLAVPGIVPNTPGRLGSLLESFRPWLGAAIPLLALVALLRRSAGAAVSLLVPTGVWLVLHGAALTAPDPHSVPETGYAVAQHNVGDDNTDPAGTARSLADTGADLIGLQEITPELLPAFSAILDSEYPHHVVSGTLGLWSRHPLDEVRNVPVRPATLGPEWTRGMLRARARTPDGDLAVYVAHLPSVRVGPTGFTTRLRDEAARVAGEALADEPLERIVLLGDLNGTIDDRGLGPITDRMDSTGGPLRFSWPETFPIARIDHVMTRGLEIERLLVMPATGSDHLPIYAHLNVPPTG